MTLAQRIKQAREDKGLTQADLAQLSGVRQQMISKLERALSNKTAFIVTLAKTLDVKPAWLQGVEEDKGKYSTRKKQSQISIVLDFIQEHCIEELGQLPINQQLEFISLCLTQVKNTKRKSDYTKTLSDCLKSL